MSTLATASGNFEDIYSKLLTLSPPLRNPSKPSDAALTDKISSLYLHPALEIALHILNNDLVSAHFLVRHMEAAPAYEAMFLHGILHRIEGDLDNARAWYKDVADSDAFKATWSSKEEGLAFIDQIDALINKKDGDEVELEKKSLDEIKRVVEFMVDKFGSKAFQNAEPEYHYAKGEGKEIKEKMLLGDRGHRNF